LVSMNPDGTLKQEPAGVPAALAVDGCAFLGIVKGVGHQIYRLADDQTWKLERPDAQLFLDHPDHGTPVQVGLHYGFHIGNNEYRPRWRQTYNPGDQSTVQGEPIKAVKVNPTAIAWVKLELAHLAGAEGVFSAASWVQRINT